MVVEEGAAPLRRGGAHRLHHRGLWRGVIEIRQHYRTDDRWWTDDPVARDYFDLLLEGGQPLTVFHDLIERRWYAQRYG